MSRHDVSAKEAARKAKMEEDAKWNDDGAAMTDSSALEPSFWKNEPILLACTALVLLVDVVSAVAILTVVEDNDRASGT
jgi:hypothetical protein